MSTTKHHQQETEQQKLNHYFRHNYGPHVRIQLNCPEQPFGRTKQSFKDECDINTILSRFQRTGLLEFVNERHAQYGDVSSIDFQDSLNTVIEAQAMFDDLPAAWRKRFNNDPAQLLDFVQDPGNREEAIKLGICKAPPPSPTGGEPSPEKPASKAV